MKVRVDPLKCQGYGYCVELASQVFSYDDWGYVQANDVEILPELQANVKLAIDKCPVKAIRQIEFKEDKIHEKIINSEWEIIQNKLLNDKNNNR